MTTFTCPECGRYYEDSHFESEATDAKNEQAQTGFCSDYCKQAAEGSKP